MHAILASLGTDGDVLPFVAIGRELLARGHKVTLFAAANYADLAAAHHLEFHELVSTEKMRELIGNPIFWHPLKTARFTARWAESLIEPQFRTLQKLLTKGPQVLVTNPAIFAANLANEALGIPLAHVVLQPWLIPSATAPPVMPIIGLPPNAPAIFNRLFYHAMDFAADLLVGPTVNRVRRSLGLPKQRHILTTMFSKQLVIGMFPDWFGPPQPDWPKNTHLAGFPRFDGAVKRTLPPDILQFVTRKTPTILFTFGSGMMHAQQLFDAATRACAQLQVQGLFVNRFFTPNSKPAHMLHANFLPFSEVFPHCAVIVHHGGIGTTAECFASARPQLILPLGFDQLDNGVRVKKLGVGLHTRSKHGFVAHQGPIPQRHVDEIAASLRQLLSLDYRERCSTLAQRLRADRPLERAADLIENLVRARPDA